MPVETNLYNKLNGAQIGTLVNLGATQPYVPKLVGGEVDGSYMAGKSQQFNGDFTSGPFISGVDVLNGKITAFNPGGEKGSYASDLDASWDWQNSSVQQWGGNKGVFHR